LITYYKLRRIAKDHRLDTLIIGLGPHNLGDYDLRQLKQQGWATERSMQRLAPLISLREAWRLPLDRSYFLRSWFNTYCVWPRSMHDAYIGNFIKLHRPYKDDSEFTASRHFLEPDGTPASPSPTALAFLDSIVSFTHQHHIQLVLLGVPDHPDYLRRIPSDFQQAYMTTSTLLRSEGVHVIDHISLYEQDSLFAMSDHLGARGAKAFTVLLRDELSSRTDSLVAQ
ncbi:MAG TPA: hypothetical protein PK760_06470, partial [Flavobacteriales bacterium]|nr:hypothetical protein [Flavobacteriales bacterium]